MRLYKLMHKERIYFSANQLNCFNESILLQVLVERVQRSSGD